ncbi:hypothetical protein [Planktothrix tepida]|uniref:hypothetical protein n=1 Tax=Planktothrix tepida TaxID=1678309 RepID=UPI00164825CB|nr:hypothetical protein [Planktothrix tepida]
MENFPLALVTDAPSDLRAIASNIQPCFPLWFHSELEKRAKQGGILCGSRIISQ